MKEDRVLITGGGGMLGEAVYDVFSKKYKEILATDIDLNEKWLQCLDVRDVEECKRIFKKAQPTIVIHLAALTDLEFCEKNKKEAWETNAWGTKHLALLAKQYDSLMIYISSAGIFDGKKDFFTDFDVPRPLNYYGKSKYYGECFVKNTVTKYFVFRAGWMMGGGVKKDKKFINKVYKQIKEGKKELFVVNDKLGSPTYTKNFAEAMAKVIETKYYGVYNQVCTGSASRLDVAKEFVRLLGLSNSVKITEVSSAYFKDEYFVPRPYSETLVNLKLTSRGINHMRDWKDCLQEYSKIFYDDYYGKV